MYLLATGIFFLFFFERCERNSEDYCCHKIATCPEVLIFQNIILSLRITETYAFSKFIFNLFIELLLLSLDNWSLAPC